VLPLHWRSTLYESILRQYLLFIGLLRKCMICPCPDDQAPESGCVALLSSTLLLSPSFSPRP